MEPIVKIYGIENITPFLVQERTIEGVWFWIKKRTKKTKLYSTKDAEIVHSNRSVTNGEIFILMQ